jgi:small subunit ribosomal protein S5
VNKVNADDLGLKDEIVAINRVTKVVKGGRNFRFAALIVVGDGKGRVGFGLGKAAEVPEAVRKGKENAKKNMIFVELNLHNSIYHEVIGRYGSSSVLIKPALDGAGLIAGGAVRVIMELAGIQNIRAKSLGSNNKYNVTRAVFNALANVMTPKKVAWLRGKDEEVYRRILHV